MLLPFAQMKGWWMAQPRTLFCVPATSWRQELLHRKSPKNDEIEVVVNYLCGRIVQVKPGLHQRIIDLPAARDGDAREHIVDALGGALVVASTMLGARFRVPDDVRAAQHEARERGRRRKSVLTTLDRLGVDAAAASYPDGSPVAGKGRRPARATRKARRVTGANTKAFNARGTGTT
jgi:hypothetical protein